MTDVAAAARIANILHRAVRDYLRDDQRASYPLTGDVWVTVDSRRVRRIVPVGFDFTTKDGSLSIRRLVLKDGRDVVRFTAHAFQRASNLWNGPDVLRNNGLASMFASLFHDLLWIHRVEIADALGLSVRHVLHSANDVFILAWRFIDPSLWGRVKSYFAFQAVSAAVPWYHKAKGAVTVVLASLLLGGCSGCFSLPDGEVVEAGGVEIVEQVMRDYGDGLGPDPETEAEESE